MDEYLSKIGYNFWETSISLPAGLETIVKSEFVIDHDCVVLKEVGNITNNPTLETALMKCEWEDFATHFHPDSFIDNVDEIEYLKLALESGKRLAKRLEAEFPSKTFRLTISFSETKIENGEIETYGSSAVRFYQIREDCEDIMRITNIDDFKLDAVLEIEKPLTK
jgi:hypothetical protein